MKTCTKCGEVKALDAFHQSKPGKRHPHCAACALAYAAAYRKANPEKLKAKAKAIRKANLETYRANGAAYRKANPEKKAAIAARSIAEMRPSYIGVLLGIHVSALTPELIALKREQLEIRRLARQLKQATKDEHASI